MDLSSVLNVKNIKLNTMQFITDNPAHFKEILTLPYPNGVIFLLNSHT